MRLPGWISSGAVSCWSATMTMVEGFAACSGTAVYRHLEAGVLVFLLAVLALVEEEQVVFGVIGTAVAVMLNVTRDFARRGIVLAIASVCVCMVVAFFWPLGGSGLPRLSLRDHPVRGVVMVGDRFLGDGATLHLLVAPYDVRTDWNGRFEFLLGRVGAESLSVEVEYDGQRYPFVVDSASQLRRGVALLFLNLLAPGPVHPRLTNVADLVSESSWKRRVLIAFPVGVLLAGGPCIAVRQQRGKRSGQQPEVGVRR